MPLADGGEGTVRALVTATNGGTRRSRAHDPLGREIDAEWGVLGDGTTAVVEMAAASGLPLLQPRERDARITSTRGTGELILAAAASGAHRIVIGIGGSATNDGGAGMARACGYRFLDRDGIDLPEGGAALARLARIDGQTDPRLVRPSIDVACDVRNPLLGPEGASAIYGPQKGATPEIVRELDAALARYADVVEAFVGRPIRNVPGAGAAGGLGAGLLAFLDARLVSGAELVLRAVRFPERIPVDRTPSLELVRITEAAAIAAAHWMGHGNNNEADQAAVEAMRKTMEDARFNGMIVIGEGERDEAPMLFIGERVGRGEGPELHIAVDPLEGTNPVAKGRPNACAVMAVSEPGGLLHAPDTYMEKLVVGAPARGKVDLDRPVAENLRIIAQSLNRDVSDLTIVILDRPRHEKLINDVRAAGARIKLIEDGDLMASLSVPIAGTDVHAVMGTGGAPEGVLAAAALRCLGAEILGRLRFRNDEERRRAKKMGVADEERVYRTEDLASGTDIRFVATGVTDGEVLKGVHFFARGARTHSLLLDRLMGKLRFIDTTHFEDIDHPPLIRLE